MGRAESLAKVLLDSQSHIQSNHVGQAQWIDWVAVAVDYGAVEISSWGDALFNHADHVHPRWQSQDDCPQKRVNH